MSRRAGFHGGDRRAAHGREFAPAPERPGQRSPNPVCGYGWGVVAPGLCTLLNWPLRHILGSASILLVYLLGVFLVAARYGRGASVVASLLSAPAFAYFFAPPIFSLAMSDLENIVGLGIMLVVAHLTSGLLERAREQARIASRRERHATALYRLGRALADARSEQDAVRTAIRHIRGEFGVAAALLLPDRNGRLRPPGDGGLQETPPAIDLEAAQRIFDMGLANGGGSEPDSGDAALYLPLVGYQGRVGILVLPSSAPRRVDPETGTFLDTFRGQIAQALDRIRLDGQAREASVQAEAEALRNSLLSAISHDLRTPLTRIVGSAGTLVDRDDALTREERRAFNKAIQDEAQHMSELMGKILDMARLTTGKLVPHREWNTLEEIVGGTLNRLDRTLRDRPVPIRLPDDLPLIWVDAVLLQQVLVNLIENAIKYTPAGSPIEIAAECLPTRIGLTVADRGPGLPEGAEEKLFEKFHRLESESPHSGAGLGLALCRAIVEAHGGTLVAANRPGGGALFSLTLPRHEPPPMAWEEPVESEP